MFSSWTMLNYIIIIQLGRTPLTWAALSGQMTAAATLIDAGADVNHADGAGMAPLDHAVTFLDNDSFSERGT